MIGRGRSSSLLGFVIAAVVAVPSAAFVMERTVLNNTPDHEMQLTSSSGALAITNSHEGQAILTAAPMTPGSTTTGTVDLKNSGDSDETLTLDAGTPSDTPGPGGGRLSERLLLQVVDVSDASAPQTVYSGRLTGVDLVALGTLPKGAQRSYRFIVTFPDGGANGADNAFQGSSASIGFDWTIGAAAATTTPTPAPQPEPAAPAPQPAPVATPSAPSDMSVETTPSQPADPCPAAVTAQGGTSSMWAVLNARSKARANAKAKALARAKARAKGKSRAKGRANARAKSRAKSRAAAKAKRSTCARTGSGRTG